jgi:DNA-binding sugar fermentation-stimulating protein
MAVFSVFLSTVITFTMYNRLVDKRQKLVLGKAAQTSAIVSSLFPKRVMEKLIEEEQQKQEEKSFVSSRFKSFMSNDEKIEVNAGPVRVQIADLFPNCTVLFADIVGFTAWSRYVI